MLLITVTNKFYKPDSDPYVRSPILIQVNVITQVLADVAAIALDPDNVARALGHLHSIIARAVASKAPVLVPKAKEARKRLKLAERKLWFFLSWWGWLSGHGDGKGEDDEGSVAPKLLAAVRVEIGHVHTVRMKALNEVETDRRAYETAWSGPTPPRERPLIEEL